MRHQSNGVRSVRRGLALAATVAALSGVALAQRDPAPAHEDGFDQPLRVTDPNRNQPANRDGAPSISRVWISTQNGITWEVRYENGAVSATRNGEQVPAERVRRTDRAIEVLNAEGGVMHSVPFAGPPRAERRGQSRVFRMQPPAPQAPPIGPEAEPIPQPPVMLGIMNVDGEDGIEVASVVEGLPAAKAGVREGDVIRRLDGAVVRTTRDLRSAMMNKRPGDRITLDIERGGRDLRLEVELAAFDASRLGEGGPQGLTFNFDDDFVRELGRHWRAEGAGPDATGWREWHEEAREALDRALEQITESNAFRSERLKAETQRSITDLQARLDELRAQLEARIQNEGRLDRLLGQVNRGQGPRRGEPLVLSVPRAPEPPASPELSRSLDRLASALERLEKRLDAIEKRMDEPRP